MSLYLGYTQIIGLSTNQQIAVDRRVRKSRKQFVVQFINEANICLPVFLAFMFGFSSKLDSIRFSCGLQCQSTIRCFYGYIFRSIYRKSFCYYKAGKPGFRPLDHKVKGLFVGSATGVCSAALQSGDYLLGMACATLCLVAGIIMNRLDN